MDERLMDIRVRTSLAAYYITRRMALLAIRLPTAPGKTHRRDSIARPGLVAISCRITLVVGKCQEAASFSSPGRIGSVRCSRP